MTGVVYDSLDLEQVEIKMTSSKIGLKFQVRPQKLSYNSILLKDFIK
jgi:hypothetical protein